MPLRKDNFTVVQDDLTKAVDVDDSQGREVPVNMNYVEEGYLIKDTGTVTIGAPTDDLAHSIFYFQRKDGTNYLIRGLGTKLQRYSFIDRAWYNIENSPTFTAGAEFGYVVYDDWLYFCNGVESLHRWDGTTFTEYAPAPKGNILTIFEDRLFVAGVASEPLTVYYSNVGNPTIFSVADLLKPLGTDHVTNMTNFYGQLLIFKERSIWKLTFVYDQVVTLFVPKLEIQSNNYGACSRKAVTWVENDVWFFTGKEVRSIGYKDQQTGVLGVNRSVISDQIKETLKRVATTSYSSASVFYEERRFYLSVFLGTDVNPTMFVCHLLYGSNWTKYVERDKAKLGSATVVNDIIYSTLSTAPFGTIKWTVEAADSQAQTFYLVTE